MHFAKSVTAFRQSRLNKGLEYAIAAFAFCLLLLPVESAGADYASLVMDANTGRVIYARNADRKNYPASLTKMMTLYMVFEALDDGRLTRDQRLHVSRRAAAMPPSKLGLRRGQSIKVKDAILSLVTKSANDVAVVIAEALGKTESQFADMMTRKARALGMSRTRFRNASGLPDRRQVSTARDMAKLARVLQGRFPHHYKYFSINSFTYKGRTYRNHNRLLKTYKGTDGIKTGYIRASGYNLVASAVRGGRRIIAVVFGGKTPGSRNRHMAKLLDKGFAAIQVARAQRLPQVPDRKPGLFLAQASAATGAGAYQFKQVSPKTRLPLVEQTVAAKPKVAKGVRKTDPGVTFGKLAKPWGIQVGAYYGYVRAERAATAAARRVPDLLNGAHIWIPHVKGDRGRLYQSRLMGLSETEANGACHRLRQSNVDCVIIQLRKGISTAFLGPKIELVIAN